MPPWPPYASVQSRRIFIVVGSSSLHEHLLRDVPRPTAHACRRPVGREVHPLAHGHEEAGLFAVAEPWWENRGEDFLAVAAAFEQERCDLAQEGGVDERRAHFDGVSHAGPVR